MAFDAGAGEGFHDPGMDPTYAQSQPKPVQMNTPSVAPVGSATPKESPDDGGVMDMAKMAGGGGGGGAATGGGSSMGGDPTSGDSSL